MQTSRFSNLLHVIPAVLMVVSLAACSGEGVVDVDDDGSDAVVIVVDDGTKSDEPTGNENPDPGVTSLRLDEQNAAGRQIKVTNQLIEVDGSMFTRGGGSEGAARFHFFFGYVNRAIYSGGSGDSVDVGLFVYSDEPFEGASAAGFFEGATLSFSVGGHSVVITSRNLDGTPSGTPILGSGSPVAAYAIHVPNFSWTAPSGRKLTNVIGSAQELSSILNHDDIRYEFNVERGKAWVNDRLIGSVAGIGSDPFEYFFIYAGTGDGGLFVVSDRAFDSAAIAGSFVGSSLDFSIHGFHVVFESDVVMLTADERSAWVFHDPAFVWNDHGHDPSHPLFGVTGDLTGLLNR